MPAGLRAVPFLQRAIQLGPNIRRRERTSTSCDAGTRCQGIKILMAPDVLISAPINKDVNRDNGIGRIEAGQTSCQPDIVANIDDAGVRGDVVVVMGEEIVRPNKDAG